jgi:hypothetical protein
MADSPADITRQAVAEFRRRAQNPCLRRNDRDQYAALGDLFNELAADMAFGVARELARGGTTIVGDDQGHHRPDWTAALAAARAWLIPTPEVER